MASIYVTVTAAVDCYIKVSRYWNFNEKIIKLLFSDVLSHDIIAR